MWKLPASCCLLVMTLALATPLRAEDAPPAATAAATASALLDEAIWWPGDFGQVCWGDSNIGPFLAPHLAGYGSVVGQDYFLSEEMTGRLKARRAEIVAELQKRLQAFDWEHVPKLVPVPKRVTQMKDKGLATIEKGDAGPGPWRPQNPRALTGGMLRIIEALDAVEVLPELLRIEDQLNTINANAVEWTRITQFSKPPPPPMIKLPALDLGGRAPDWDGITSEYVDSKKSTWAKWKIELFEHLVFQREMLGTALQMAERANYAPLKDSLVGRLRSLGLRRQGLLNAEWSKIGTKEEFTAKADKQGLHWDDALGVPLREDEQVNIPWSDAVRESARAIIQAFAKGEPPPAVPDGATLLREAILQPGDWSQMCGGGRTLPLDVPLSPDGAVADHFYSWGGEASLRLQAYRDKVVPALVDSLHRIDARQPAPKDDPAAATGSGQRPDILGPLVIDAVRAVNAVEALPELLRIEQDLHELIVRVGKDPAFTPPRMNVDTWTNWAERKRVDSKDAGAMKEYARTEALFTCRILQRKVLGVIWSVLIAEFYPSARGSKVEQAFWAAGTKQTRDRLEKAKSVDGLKWWIKDPEVLAQVWDAKKKQMLPINDAVVEDVSAKISARAAIPYTEAARDEMRAVTEEFLRTVPPEKRKAGDAMSLPWLPPGPRGE